MKVFKLYTKTITLVLIVIGFFTHLQQNLWISLVELIEFLTIFLGCYYLMKISTKNPRIFKKLNGLETSHTNYSVKYLYSLVNSGNIKKAIDYSKKLEKQKINIFESQLIMGIFHLKNTNWGLAQKYFHKAKTSNPRFILNKYLSNSLYNCSVLGISNLIQETS